MKKTYMMMAAAMLALSMNAQDVLNGTVTVGDYDGATAMVEGSFFDSAPTTFYVAHTGSQMIYTADDLADFTGKSNVKLTKLTYRYHNESFEDMVRDVKVYVQNIDANAFAVVENVKQFFDFDETNPVLDGEFEYSLLDVYGDDGELEFDLSNNPVAIEPGKSVLVTVVMDAQDDDNCTESSFDTQFYSSGLRNRAMTFTNNTVSFLTYKDTEDFPKATAMLGCGTAIDLPVTKIDYTYTESTSTAIEDVKAAIATDGAYYNLMGQKLDGSNLPAGIYIHNGKKYIAK